ncbi:thiol:disulfide interchange protein tlpA [Bacillus sp. J14TS2]|uniref:TlpA family protein disulfide reductase n=1 Tax=Bacillus sp. J14TS2 TaxID=2807188 RepID=UPI001B150E9C|nr:redoxin domain-containing protein [Bacillus sp. J14TS2]GIN73346.1 thiol:disulfide interchange protein tlpA [Bacillus sp. J14TS2]
MKKAIFIIVFVLMFGWAVYEFISNKEDTAKGSEQSSVSSGLEIEQNGNEIGLERGNTAPDIKLKTIEGEEVQLSDYRGKKVMLNFWATWCPPCRAEMPDMEKFHQDTDIEILAVNLIESETNQDLEKVVDFIDDYELTFPVLVDKGNEAAILFRISPIPTSYLINSDGTIHNMAFGALNYELMIQEFEKMK